MTADPKVSDVCVHSELFSLPNLTSACSPLPNLSKTWLSSEAVRATDIFGHHLAASACQLNSSHLAGSELLAADPDFTITLLEGNMGEGEII